MCLPPNRTSCELVARNENRAGFSLVELLVAIAILGVLAAILVAATGIVRGKADLVKCGNNMRQLGLSVMLSSQSNGNMLPGASNPYWDFAALKHMEGDGHPTYSEILHCPADNVERTGNNSNEPRSYSLNAALCNFGGQFTNITDWGANPPPANVGMNMAALPNASKTVLLIERHNALNVYNSGAWVSAASLYDAHDGHMNVVFCDGHVEALDVTMDVWDFRRNYLSRGRY